MAKDYMIAEEDINIFIPNIEKLPLEGILLTAYTVPRPGTSHSMVLTNFAFCPYITTNSRGLVKQGLKLMAFPLISRFDYRKELMDFVRHTIDSLLESESKEEHPRDIVYANSTFSGNYYIGSEKIYPATLSGIVGNEVKPFVLDYKALKLYGDTLAQENKEMIETALPKVQESAMEHFKFNGKNLRRIVLGKTITSYFGAPEHISKVFYEANGGKLISKQMDVEL